MGKETEQRPSGLWTVHYNPEVPKNELRSLFRFVDDLAELPIRHIYTSLQLRRVACIPAVVIWSKFQDGFRDCLFASQAFGFTDPLEGQSGQVMLRVGKPGISAFTIMDVAPYLYRPTISFSDLPIVVDNDLQGAAATLSGIYTNLLGRNVSLYPHTLGFE